MSIKPYVFPPFPSLRVKAVKEYLKYVSEFDFYGLNGLITDDFILAVSPMNMGVPNKTRDEEFAFLKEIQAKLDGRPLVITVYDVNDGETKTWVHAKLEPIDLEIVYCFCFAEGHNAYKITSLREFIDSKMYWDNAPKPKASSEPST